LQIIICESTILIGGNRSKLKLAHITDDQLFQK